MSELSISEGTPLPEVATLHEKSVQAVARGEVPSPRRTRASNGRRVLATTTRDTRVNPAVMRAALALVDGDTSRISIISEHEVVVLNHKRGM